jgi:hypothetical protein
MPKHNSCTPGAVHRLMHQCPQNWGENGPTSDPEAWAGWVGGGPLAPLLFVTTLKSREYSEDSRNTTYPLPLDPTVPHSTLGSREAGIKNSEALGPSGNIQKWSQPMVYRYNTAAQEKMLLICVLVCFLETDGPFQSPPPIPTPCLYSILSFSRDMGPCTLKGSTSWRLSTNLISLEKPEIQNFR